MEGIILRSAELTDIQMLAEAFEHSSKALQPWAYPPEDIDRYISSQRVYLLCNSQAIIGVFTISGISRGLFHSGYLGYNVFVPFQGKGYMAFGLKLLLTEAFQILKLHRLEANIQPENSRSIELVSRNGFQKEGYSKDYLRIGGVWRDHERWAIINPDWSE